ncbi:VOC family protein [Verticiella sediminum]|uniref:2-oxoadipate dioxygenase/decarboxylase n=1 Tax=Verticiella sediminum TaxID=1247510 RepID=A0A556B1I3_9BURK|nr:VOC family protein [Verticiella sediminum]TSH99022.1 VOC family protein [Verticiella sediminum]
MSAHVSPDVIRARFADAMSDMYRLEVPQYGTLLKIVADINRQTADAAGLTDSDARLGVERHGAIRLGTAEELATMRRILAVMGMYPVGYYDLSVAGVPVHSTAFRPVAETSLEANPFRLFTSLLRLELIEPAELREDARAILARRRIFTDGALSLTARAERDGGLDEAAADAFVAEVLETFRWHDEATVDADTYRRLHGAHPLAADILCFKGPHINHLTPRTLDIDAAQVRMGEQGLKAKNFVEGPPRRRCPILLRQTSFRALQEAVRFPGEGSATDGTHTARFGEIEQRGAALTPKGRALYDRLLAEARAAGIGDAQGYGAALAQAFAAFPDDWDTLRREGLAYFRYDARGELPAGEPDLEALIAQGLLAAHPITYEDFLPVSAAGIFQSNLGGEEQQSYAANAAKAEFERDLGAAVQDEFALYAGLQQASIDALRRSVRAAA